MPCRLCKDRINLHKEEACPQYTTPHDRDTAAYQMKLCKNCLKPGHTAIECRNKYSCRTCNERHHTSLHKPTKRRDFNDQPQSRAPPTQRQPYHPPAPNQARPPQTSQTPQFRRDQSAAPARRSNVHVSFDSSATSDQNVSLHSDSKNEEHQPTTEEEVTSAGKTEALKPGHLLSIRIALTTTTTVILDCGSSNTYITTALAETLQLSTINKENLHIYSFGSDAPSVQETPSHTVSLSLHDKRKKLMTLRSTPFICNHLNWLSLENDGIQPKTSQPGILVGIDYIFDLLFSKDFHIKELRPGLFQLNTALGPIVAGRLLDNMEYHSFISSVDPPSTALDDYKDLEKLMEKFWELDSIGITEPSIDKDDEECLKIFKDTIAFDKKENRYMVSLPFRLDPSALPSNFSMAYKRLQANYRTLSQNPDHISKYDSIFQEQLKLHILEDVPADELFKQQNVHYLPHHGITKETSTTTKLRCVVDGSARLHDELSLNDTLYRGPVILPDLLGVLLRTRTAPILLSGDVEKAFLQVGVQPQFRDWNRLLWLKDPHKPPSKENLRVLRFTRVCFGLICSPFLLAAAICHHLDLHPSPLNAEIKKNLYVDNVYLGASSTAEALEHFHSSRRTFSSAGMNLREFVSNDPATNRAMEDSGAGQATSHSKVLGIHWHIEKDTYSLPTMNKPDPDKIWTKRQVLKYVASIYDCMGFCNPSSLPLKAFQQSLWTKNRPWDTALEPPLVEKWHTLIHDFDPSSIFIPRLVTPFPREEMTYELHTFVDASEVASCAVSYLVSRRSDGHGSPMLLLSKTRLSPLKSKVPIPRLELIANVLGSTLSHHIKKEIDLPISQLYIWTDSRIALCWITGDKRIPIFIRNRVSTIMKLTPEAEFRHIAGTSNPADVGSRGCTSEELRNHPLWWHGPTFLARPQSQWPSPQNSPVSDAEFKSMTLFNTSSIQPPASSHSPIRFTYFSTWNRLLHTTKKLLLFAAKTSKRLRRKYGSREAILQRAEKLLLHWTQEDNPPSEKQLHSLCIYKCSSSGMLRCRGPVDKSSDLSFDTRFPIFLHGKAHVTRLICLHFHKSLQHAGRDQTVISLRQKYWIPHDKTVVNNVIIKDCYVCKRTKARPYKLPEFPPHPEFRVSVPPYAFYNSGMDIAGPLIYKTKENTQDKYWILLLTCLNCRAVHLDTLLGLTTSTLLKTIRRFVAEYGQPRRIICDNAAQFKLLSYLQSHLLPTAKNVDLLDYCAQEGMQFKFIPAHSPWSGGFYEKMADLTKRHFKSAIGRRILPLDDIQNLLKETQAILNSRSLTACGENLSTPPIRPIDLIRPSAPLSLPRLQGEDEDFSDPEWKPSANLQDNIMDAWHSSTATLSKFWDRWKREYLTSLRERTCREHKSPRSTEESKPQTGDVVVIEEDNHDRGQWRLGMIINTNDNYERSAIVKVPSGGTISRPINHLYKLEISPTDEHTTTKTVQRSEKKSRSTRISPALLMMTIILSLFRPSSATRCTSSFSTNSSSPHAYYTTTCTSNGVVIARSSPTSICWYSMQCPIGHLQAYEDRAYCGKKCSCPDWADACSHSRTSFQQYSNGDRLPQELKNYRPSDFCSFDPSPSCADHYKLDLFNQVQLYDQSIWFLPTLELRATDFTDIDDYLCVNATGKLLFGPVSGPLSGSTQFCNHHHCSSDSTTLCFYVTPVTQLVSVELNPPLLIRAWATITKKYYPKKASDLPTLQGSLECIKGGGNVTLTTEATISACINDYCIYHPNSNGTTIYFPTEMVFKKYTLLVTAQTSDGRQTSLMKICSGNPFCDTIQCFICPEWLLNYQCWTWLDYLILVFSVLLLLISATIVSCLYQIYWLTTIFLWIVSFIPLRIIRLLRGLLHKLAIRIQALFKRRQDPLLPMTIQDYDIPSPSSVATRKRIKPSNSLLKSAASLSVILSLFSTTECCSLTTSLTATSTSCSNGSCIFTETTHLTMLSYGQE